jgi:hypothetical protein
MAPADGTYLFGASLLYKVNASTTARMNGRLVLNGSTEIKGGKGEISATHVSLPGPFPATSPRPHSSWWPVPSFLSPNCGCRL